VFFVDEKPFLGLLIKMSRLPLDLEFNQCDRYKKAGTWPAF
jgi:hypothetical protein